MQSTEGMVTLQERMVNLVKQLNMPVLESSLVIGKWVNRLKIGLVQHSSELPLRLAEPWPLSVEPVESETSFDLDKALSLVDRDRMDILDTLIRVTIEEVDLNLAEALGMMRSWEHLVRGQLSQAAGPGQLFSPTEIPDDF